MSGITEAGANRALVRMLGSDEAGTLISQLVFSAADGVICQTLSWPEIAEIVKDVAVEVSENADWEEVARYIVDGPKESNIDMPEGGSRDEKADGAKAPQGDREDRPGA